MYLNNLHTMIVSRNPLHVLEGVLRPQDPCLICLEETPYSRFHRFPCNCNGHFHNECLESWYVTNRFRECPMCRKQIGARAVEPRRYPVQIYIEATQYVQPRQHRLYINDLFRNDITLYHKCYIIMGLIIGLVAITIGFGFPAFVLYLLATNK